MLLGFLSSIADAILGVFIPDHQLGAVSYESTLQRQAGRTVVRVYSGFGWSAGARGWGGNVPGVCLWDEVGRYIGHRPGTEYKVAENAFVDIEVPHKEGMNGVNAAYISISDGGNDGLCVAQVDVKFPDDTTAVWTGGK